MRKFHYPVVFILYSLIVQTKTFHKRIMHERYHGHVQLEEDIMLKEFIKVNTMSILKVKFLRSAIGQSLNEAKEFLRPQSQNGQSNVEMTDILKELKDYQLINNITNEYENKTNTTFPDVENNYLQIRTVNNFLDIHDTDLVSTLTINYEKIRPNLNQCYKLKELIEKCDETVEESVKSDKKFVSEMSLLYLNKLKCQVGDVKNATDCVKCNVRQLEMINIHFGLKKSVIKVKLQDCVEIMMQVYARCIYG